MASVPSARPLGDVPDGGEEVTAARGSRSGFEGRAAWIWLLTVAVVLLLGLKGGGYDLVVRSEVGIVAWWIVLLGALLGLLPGARLTRRAAVTVGLLAAFTAWSALATTWTLSTELTFDEVSRLIAYLGILVLAVGTFGDRATALRHVIGALGAAIALLGALGLLSRLHPGLFPGAGATAALLPGSQRRLAWPIGYWNALAALMALGLPLLLALATSARAIAARAAAAAAVPVLALVIYFTFSRQGALAALVATLAFLLLAPERLPKLLVAVVVAGASAALVAAASGRHALAQGLTDAAARHEGTTLLVATVLACALAGGLTALIALAVRREHVPRALPLPLRPAQLRAGLLATLLVLVVAALALGAPHRLAHAWQQFKQPPSATLRDNAIGRFSSLSGNDRYLYWRAAVQGLRGHWLNGSGPGTYVEVWLPRATIADQIRNAHSLYIETLSDTGVVGLVLLAAFLLALLAAALAGRRADPGVPARRDARRRTAAAATAAAGLAFLVSAAFDWIWQVPVVPVALLLLAGAALAPARAGAPDVPAGRDAPARPRLGARLGVIGLALLALALIAVPLAATSAVRASQSAAARGDLRAALADARTATGVEPDAGSAHLQAALVLELARDVPRALAEARAATRVDPRNAQDWLVLSRLEAEDGQAGAAVLAFRRARALDPISLLTRL